jgi:hypothetical protein
MEGDSDAGESESQEDCTQELHQELEALKAFLGPKYVSYVPWLRCTRRGVRKTLFEALVGVWCLLHALAPIKAAAVDLRLLHSIYMLVYVQRCNQLWLWYQQCCCTVYSTTAAVALSSAAAVLSGCCCTVSSATLVPLVHRHIISHVLLIFHVLLAAQGGACRWPVRHRC